MVLNVIGGISHESAWNCWSENMQNICCYIYLLQWKRICLLPNILFHVQDTRHEDKESLRYVLQLYCPLAIFKQLNIWTLSGPIPIIFSFVKRFKTLSIPMMLIAWNAWLMMWQSLAIIASFFSFFFLFLNRG